MFAMLRPLTGASAPPARSLRACKSSPRRAGTTTLSGDSAISIKEPSMSRNQANSPSSAGTFTRPGRSGGVLLFRGHELLADPLPVDHVVEDRLHELRALVLVVEVVRVLPDVARHERRHLCHVGTIGVARRHDVELAVLRYEPRPATAELRDGL